MANGKFKGGDGTLATPYLIEDGYDLNAIRNNLTASYKIVKNIDATQVCNDSDGKGWVPIEAFRGTLDGNGFVVRNLYINHVANNRAMFSSTRGGAITNLGLVSVNIIGGTQYCAPLVGQMTTQECLVENCFATGRVSATGNMGGLVAHIGGGNVRNCFSETDLVATATVIGGIAAVINNAYSEVKNCYYAGSIIGGTGGKGGTVATISAGKVTNCFFDGSKNPFGGAGSTPTPEMMMPETFVAWGDEYYNYNKKTWVLRNGFYPKLFYTEATKYLIYVDNKYKTYADQEWKDVCVDFPTEEQFSQYGITDNDLASIPRFAWAEISEFSRFELIASTDKTVVERRTVQREMVVDKQISDAVILKTTIRFDEFGDSINKIRIIQ